jgi:uncharacterized Zn-finger protein
MGKASKDACPKCRQKFQIGRLPGHDELARLKRMGIVSLGEPATDEVTCPTCQAKLRVAIVRMGNYFTTTD